MAPDYSTVFNALKPVLASRARLLTVKTDNAAEYTLDTRSPSPFPQHKGHPLAFGSVHTGKAYVSFHLVPLYLCPALKQKIPPDLMKRMQGKACFNFKSVPEKAVLVELKRLTGACLDEWKRLNWL